MVRRNIERGTFIPTALGGPLKKRSNKGVRKFKNEPGDRNGPSFPAVSGAEGNASKGRPDLIGGFDQNTRRGLGVMGRRKS